jgi:hypothetical protein
MRESAVGVGAVHQIPEAAPGAVIAAFQDVVMIADGRATESHRTRH